jgi:hypothetical protein
VELHADHEQQIEVLGDLLERAHRGGTGSAGATASTALPSARLIEDRFLMATRVNRARSMLRDGTAAAEVACLGGFADQST